MIIKRIYSTDSKGVTHCTVKLQDSNGKITFETIY